MAASPSYKVTNGKQYIAAFKHAEDAARFVGGQDGYRVYFRRVRISSLLWTEGAEAFSAAESFDRAATIMWARHEGKAVSQYGDHVAAYVGDPLTAH